MITHSELLRLVSYDPETGLFASKTSIGRQIGFHHRSGYVHVVLNGRTYGAHRLAWLYVHGYISEHHQIDHKDRDKANNRISNLRLADYIMNLSNAERSNPPTSGFRGVYLNGGKFEAATMFKRKRYYLGVFNTAIEASEAYKAFKRKMWSKELPIPEVVAICEGGL